MASQTHSDLHARTAGGDAARRATDRIDRVILDAEGDAEGFELWHSICRPVLDVSRRNPHDDFKLSLDFYDVDGLIFNRTRYSATDFRRTSSHLRGGEGDMIVLHMLLSGCEQGEVKKRGAVLKNPTVIVLHDWAHPFVSKAGPSEQVSVAIPRHRLAARDWIYEKQPVVSWANNSPQGVMLGSALRGVWKALPHADRTEAPALAAGFIGLVDGMLNPDRIAVDGKATLAAMQEVLDGRLHRPETGASDLTEAFRCSRATVYRLFRECGGVRSYLTERRLAKAFRILTDVARVSHSINDLAGSLGFTDSSYFFRAFRKRYGFTPGEAVESKSAADFPAAGEAADGAYADALATIHRWMGAGK